MSSEDTVQDNEVSGTHRVQDTVQDTVQDKINFDSITDYIIDTEEEDIDDGRPSQDQIPEGCHWDPRQKRIVDDKTKRWVKKPVKQIELDKDHEDAINDMRNHLYKQVGKGAEKIIDFHLEVMTGIKSDGTDSDRKWSNAQSIDSAKELRKLGWSDDMLKQFKEKPKQQITNIENLAIINKFINDNKCNLHDLQSNSIKELIKHDPNIIDIEKKIITKKALDNKEDIIYE